MTEMMTEHPAAAEHASSDASDTRRRFYYGWVMLPLAMAAHVASSPGQTFGVSIFNEPMRADLGLTHGQLAAAYMLGTLLGAIPISFCGHQMDRHGLRRTLLAVVSLFSAACILTSFVNGWLSLMFAFCLLRMLGPGALGFLSGNTLSYWFERRLGMVEGIRQLGMAVAMAVVPILNVWLVGTWGWRNAYSLLGVGIWLLLFPAFHLFIRNRPEDVGQRLDNQGTCMPGSSHVRSEAWWGFSLRDTLRMPTFWIVAAGTAMFSLIHTAVFFCLVPIFQERGLNEHDVAAALTLFAGCLAVTQLAAGTLADRVRAPVLLTAGLSGLGISMLMLYFASSSTTALAAGAAMGTAQGVFFGASHPLWARYFGRKHLGKIRGVLMTVNVAASSLGPLLAGVTRDLYGDFDFALMLFAVAPMPFALLSWYAVAPARKSETALVDPTLEVADIH